MTTTTTAVVHDVVMTEPRPVEERRVTFPRVFRMEWVKFWSLRSTAFTLAVTVAVVVGLGAIIAGVAGKPDGPGDDFSDPTQISLAGVMLAVLASAALGALMSTGEYATGSIRATLAAVPSRLPVLWAKVSVFAVSAYALMLGAVVAAFLTAQAILSSRGHDTAALGDPGVLRALAGAAVYLTGAGLLGLAVGALLRNTAAAISLVVAALFIVPGLFNLLPQSWNENVGPYLPSNAAGAFMSVQATEPTLSAGAGFAVFAGYVVVLLAGAAVALRRRDA
jgi:ABC-type transport system involved in multi-copper enzyme maturation permease subunit